jgi:alpha-2-macroglobulin
MIARSQRYAMHVMVAVAATIMLSGAAGTQPASETGGPYPYPAVAALPAPSLPPWVVQLSPTQQVDTLAQIRVRFNAPVIPLEEIESAQTQTALSHFTITPKVPGKWRFVTPRMAIFEVNRALPLATRVRVTLTAGLTDLDGDSLAHDLSWTFNTEPMSVITPDAGPYSLHPDLYVGTSALADIDSLRQRVRLVNERSGAEIPVTVEPQPSSSPTLPRPYLSRIIQPQEQFQAADEGGSYDVKPREALTKASAYRLIISPGIKPVYGNLPTTDRYVAELRTYSPLALEWSGYSGGAGDRYRATERFADGTPSMRFNNAVDPDSARRAIQISPAPTPRHGTPDAFQFGGPSITLDPWALKPATKYTVTIGASLKDTWGQTLGRTITLSFTTSDIAADFSTISGWRVYPATLGFKLPANVISLPNDEYQAAFNPLAASTLVYAMYDGMPMYDWNNPGVSPRGLPSIVAWPDLTAAGSRNTQTTLDLDLLHHLGSQYGVLAYGMSAQIPGTLYDVPDSRVVTYGRINVTNLGLFVQIMPGEAIALVHRLSDGAPVAGARVDLYIRRNSATANPPTPCATFLTGGDGVGRINARNIRRCAPWHDNQRGEESWGPAILAVARAGSDWTVADLGTGEYGSDPFNFGWDSQSIRSLGSLFSDRGLYQPGEKASFEGYAFYLQDGTLHRDERTRYALELRYPDGTTHDLGSRTTDDFGMFAIDTVVPASADVGNYTLTATSAAGVTLSCDIRVAEFKAPNFKVQLTVDKPIVVEGDTVAAEGQSDYLFGQPVDGARTSVHVSRSQTQFVPHGWEDTPYSWGPEYWPMQAPNPTSDVLSATGMTNAHGAMLQTIQVAADLPFPMSYNAELTVSDASNLTVAASANFTALPTPIQIGMNADYLAPVDKPMHVAIVTTDTAGTQVAGRRVRVTLSKIAWDKNERAYLVPGPESQITTPASQSAQAQITPKSPGWYRLSANLAGATSHAGATDRDVWVYGPGEADWGNSTDTRSVQLQLDRNSYEPGDRATVLIKSPYADADLYLAVIRHGTLWRAFERVSGSAPTLSFTVDPDMVPGAQIEAVLVRRGKPIESFKPGSITSLVRFGSAALNVRLDRRYLKVSVKPQLDRLLPGSMQTLDLQSDDYAGKSAPGRFVVVVADESVLQLTGYRLPDLVQAVYTGWPVSAVSGDNRLVADLTQPEAAKLDQPSPPISPFARAGLTSDEYALGAPRELAKVSANAAMQAPAPAAAVRLNFQQLAYFNGAVQTDANGFARVEFKVPDNLTMWRVLVVAAAATPDDDPSDYRFGNGDATFIVTKALLANPLLPQFARPGDVFAGGIATNNTTGTVGTLVINGTLTGDLSFEQNGQTSKVVSAQLPATAGTQSARYPMLAGAIGSATVEFHIALGPEGDAFRVPFTVRPLDITESVVETGVTAAESAIGLDVDPAVNPNAGGLQITMASTLLPEIIVPAKDCFLFEYLPFAEPLSSRLMVAADLQLLGKKYGQTAVGIDPVAESAADLVALQKLQRMDGGFAWWPGDGESDPLLTGYAAQALGRAQQAGIVVDAGMVSSARSYLEARLDDPDPRGFCLGSDACVERMRLEAMLGLSQLGETSDKHLDSVYAARDGFDLVTQIELARYMTALPAWKPKADAMAGKIQELVYETGRYAVLNVPDDMWWFDSITKGQAETVRLYVAERYDPAIVDRMVRSLLALRRKGSWANTYDDAQALNALIDYAALEPEPPAFKATATLADKQVAYASFSGYSNSVQDSFLPIDQMPRGPSVLLLHKDGIGTLHYIVSYSYRLSGAQPGIEEGLLVTRDVRAAGSNAVFTHMGLTNPAGAPSLPAAHVYDIGLTIVADHPVNQVVIVDPLPAGMEAVDTSFVTTPQSQTAMAGSWQIDYQQIHADRVVAFANYLAPGVYTMHYLVRTVTPGSYEWPGTQAYLEYAPDEFGRSASTSLTVTP